MKVGRAAANIFDTGNAHKNTSPTTMEMALSLPLKLAPGNVRERQENVSASRWQGQNVSMAQPHCKRPP